MYSLPPNVIFILVDDMGYADVGSYGNTFHDTPHIDRLAAEGMRFTDAYAAAPNCSPTRASILTGRWPARVGVTQYLPGNFLPHARLFQAQLPDGLPLRETLISETLQDAGYAAASIGKWHLGADEYLPEERGFDVNFGGTHWGSHQKMFAPHPVLPIPDARPRDYLTDRLAAESERFIEANRERPFFLYLPLYSVHSPIEGKADLIAKYQGRTDPSGRNNAKYAAMVEGVDQCVGRITAKLAELGLEGRTILFFFSDNGGVERRAFNGGFRRGKGWLYEAGIREPLLVKWPGVVEPGSVSSAAVSSVDFYPTILEMTGAADKGDHFSDGLSLTPVLRQSGELKRDALFWHYPHYSNAGSPPAGAVREGKWKLLEFFEDGHLELYDLEADPGEKDDLASRMPVLAARLEQRLRGWRAEVGAQMPTPNPDYDADKARMKYGLKGRWR
jgi:arylsulfatase A